MKRMIEAAKQLGSHAAKRILDWMNATMQKITHVILNGMKWNEESLLKEKPKKKILRRFTPQNDAVKIAAAVVLGVIITTTVVAKPYNCIPCKENNYCIKGIRYECPLDKPVTQGNRQTSEASCMTCVQRNGDETNPIFDPLVGDCVSCLEYDSSTPVWNGTECVACGSGTAYNAETGLCEAAEPCTENDAGVCVLTAQIDECESGYIGIRTADELAKIGVDGNYPLDGNYCLLANIDLASYGESYNNGAGWTPIGASSNSFSGIFDGNGHEISNLYSTSGGLFASVMGDYIEETWSYTAIIRNLSVKNINIKTNHCNGTGGIVNRAVRLQIVNCHVTGTIITRQTGGMAGGIVGHIYGVSLSDSTFSGLINEEESTETVGSSELTDGSC